MAKGLSEIPVSQWTTGLEIFCSGIQEVLGKEGRQRKPPDLNEFGRWKMASGFKTVEPLEYYRRFLKANCRPDGRELCELRTTTVSVGSVGTADGSSVVKLGNTTVICGIKMEFGAPPTDAPDKGYVVPNLDLSPLCSWRFQSGPPGEEAQVASQFITVDPTEEEEHLATATLTVVMDEEGKLYCPHKPGGSGLTGTKLQDCMSQAVIRHKEVKKLMDEVFEGMKPK
ncbi:exosome complex component RRP43 isoform X1 [Pontoporia blainvillei]|uniref:Ribosomal RNA-processing protein 43 n=1 Tax=Pontoporia blainvillei TaxID=48723 RepID=A0ABX0S1R1_PONBL|nr:exosome complex component RRP43 isoform X1 [Pontoporia blainvillei]